MSARKMRYRILIGAAVIGLGLVLWTATPLRAALRSTSHFIPAPEDDRVRLEPGAEQLASIVAHALPRAIATVEREHYGMFAKPVVIYVCATPDSVAKY